MSAPGHRVLARGTLAFLSPFIWVKEPAGE
jgi:hypothetical protein